MGMMPGSVYPKKIRNISERMIRTNVNAKRRYIEEIDRLKMVLAVKGR